MVRKPQEYKKVRNLRKTGKSLAEISRKLRISKSTASLWCSNVVLSKRAKDILKWKGEKGRARGSKTLRNKRKAVEREIQKKAYHVVKGMKFNKSIYEALCTLLYIAEGVTEVSYGPGFTNSDPGLVRLYLYYLRNSFNLDEGKFRVCVHLHSYHNKNKQLIYWSKVTKIPLSQFLKPYEKKNGGKRIRENYQGCVSIRYYDSKISKELRYIYLALLKRHGRVA